ncbi:MAG: aldehyde dehydrogenase [Lachnospiraceae bacterium]|nr:aldehyde dehydrogenase [Lachnospiraceae bacterium]
MEREEINKIVEKQREYFLSGATLPAGFRKKALDNLKKAIQAKEEKIAAAIKKDLGKSRDEAFFCEIGLTLSEITYMQKHLKRYAREKRVVTPIAQFASRSFVKPMPYGVTLIMSPWNYPFLLTMEPLVDALAAGNTVVVKPSAYSPATSEVMKEILEEVFSSEYVAVVTGGRAENTCLLQEKFDYIFFTGSQSVGKEVMAQAAKNLTPVTLELGGKSPCIVDKSANMKLAAKRIVFGKYLNCGQTCVAPDYILCEKSVQEQLVVALKEEIVKQYGETPITNPTYGKMINEKHFARVCGLIEKSKVAHGGNSDGSLLKIEPTVLRDVTFHDSIMQEEIFGPVLPIVTIENVDEAISIVNGRQKPLALYVFGQDKKVTKKVMARCTFGGGCINDTIIHLATSNMGFGGVGESGMGAYHGKVGFDTFSHKKSIVDKKTWMDLPMRYQPYRKLYMKLIRMVLR